MGWVELAFIALVFGVMFLGRRGGGAKGSPPAGEAQSGASHPEVLTLGSLLTAWQDAVNAARQQAEAASEPDEPDVLEAPVRVLPPVLSAPPRKPAVLPAVMEAPTAVVKRATVEVVTVDRDAEHARFHESIAPAPTGPASVRPRIRGAGELRRAVLLSEVLGPPRALRVLDAP